METYLNAGARIVCPPELTPAPGQYLLAHAGGSDSPLAVPVFLAGSAPGGFRAAPPLPSVWTPGVRLHLRGPLGRGFALPPSARRVALIAFDDSASRLRGLIGPALKQDAVIVLVASAAPEDLPEEVEVQPLRAMDDIIDWADYLAFDVARGNLPELTNRLGKAKQAAVSRLAEVLVRAPMPCGALAECGICAVTTRQGWKMACKDGPVFGLDELL